MSLTLVHYEGSVNRNLRNKLLERCPSKAKRSEAQVPGSLPRHEQRLGNQDHGRLPRRKHPVRNERISLAISLDIFRGRHRQSFEHPEALKPNQPELSKFDLPQVNHIFQPGHRMMVQVQSSLYDRNPQTLVSNIFNANADDYQKATPRI